MCLGSVNELGCNLHVLQCDHFRSHAGEVAGDPEGLRTASDWHGERNPRLCSTGGRTTRSIAQALEGEMAPTRTLLLAHARVLEGAMAPASMFLLAHARAPQAVQLCFQSSLPTVL